MLFNTIPTYSADKFQGKVNSRDQLLVFLNCLTDTKHTESQLSNTFCREHVQVMVCISHLVTGCVYDYSVRATAR